jgi:hypothetical protein
MEARANAELPKNSMASVVVNGDDMFWNRLVGFARFSERRSRLAALRHDGGELIFMDT